MNILITICGRKGSKGLNNKNIIDFCGHPLLLYTLSAASLFRKNHHKDTVDIAVNSDSTALLEIATRTGLCATVDRPPEMAGDTAAKIPVIQYSTTVMEKRKNIVYDYVIDLDITSPLRTIEDIESCLAKVNAEKSYEVVFSVVPSRRNPYFNMVRVTGDHVEKVIQSDFATRQQAPAIYDMNASIYAYRREALLNKFKNSPFDGICGIIIMKDTHVLDIDSPEDFQMMSILYQHHFSKLEAYKKIQDHIGEIQP